MTTGRRALVTGASRGIGRACAEILVARGDEVVALVRRADDAPAGTTALVADVTDAAAVTAALEAAGPLEVVVSNAGIGPSRLFARSDDAHLAEVLDTNLVGASRLVRLALPGMQREARAHGRGGRIVFVGSAGALRGAPGASAYASSKAALIGLARSVAREVAGRNITVNVVAPGVIDTDLLVGGSEATHAEARATIPLGRYGEAAEVAAAVAFLTSVEAAYVTGAVLNVDGGWGMGS